MELSFLTLDVFTKEPYAGNPLALVLVPASLSSTLSQSQKQKIAREFNLSETAFLHLHSEDGDESDTTWRVDIFLVDAEVPFAGHPTIGTASYVLQHLMGPRGGKATLMTKSGPIGISGLENGHVVADIAHNVHVHSRTAADLDDRLARKGLSDVVILAEKERASELVSIVKGMAFMCIQLGSMEELGQAKPEGKQFGAKGLLDEDWDVGFVGKYYHVKEEGEQADGVRRIRTRMIEGIMEDPATGSAACALASYLSLKNGGAEQVTKYAITQGVEMGRKSEIGVEVELEDNRKEIKSVRLSGAAVKVMEGKLFV